MVSPEDRVKVDSLKVPGHKVKVFLPALEVEASDMLEFICYLINL